MAKNILQTRDDLIDYCRKRLGEPVVRVNITEEQAIDRVNDALDYWHEYHYDGSERLYLARKLTENDVETIKERRVLGSPDGHIAYDGKNYSKRSTVGEISNGINIALDPNIISVIRVLPQNSFTFSGNNLLNASYHAFMSLVNDRGYDLPGYFFFRMKIADIAEIFVNEQAVRFNRHTNYMTIEGEPTRWGVGDWIVLEVFRKMVPYETPEYACIIDGRITAVTDRTSFTITVQDGNMDQVILDDGVNIADELVGNQFVKVRLNNFPPTLEYRDLAGITDEDGASLTTMENVRDESTLILTTSAFASTPKVGETVSLVIDTRIMEDAPDGLTNEKITEWARDQVIWRWKEDNLHFVWPDSDENGYRQVWNDRWLRDYAYLLIKRQWGENLKKMEEIPGPAGITVNGQQIFDEANEEIERLNEEILTRAQRLPLARYA